MHGGEPVRLGLKQVAVMVALRSGDELLLLCRSKEPNRGRYVPVGGRVDPFESPRAAATREVREETGYEVPAPRLRGVLVESSPTKYNWVVFVYSAEVERGPLAPCAEGELHWVPFDRVPCLPTPETDGYIYRLIMEGQPFVLNAVYDSGLRLLRLENELESQLLHQSGDPGR
jgi:8-oxo-dGTP diphosphatase